VLLALQVVAFSEPTQTPPGGNVPAPINVGSAQQTKSGGLTVGSLASLGSAFLATNSGNVGIGTINPSQKLDVIGYVRGATGLCIGGDCRTSWPPDGFSQVEYKTCEGSSSTNEVSCTAFCSSGYTLVGGGCRGEQVSRDLYQSVPNAENNGWVCEAQSDYYGNTISGTAICVR